MVDFCSSHTDFEIAAEVVLQCNVVKMISELGEAADKEELQASYDMEDKAQLIANAMSMFPQGRDMVRQAKDLIARIGFTDLLSDRAMNIMVELGHSPGSWSVETGCSSIKGASTPCSYHHPTIRPGTTGVCEKKKSPAYYGVLPHP